ncbi:MAG TPA: urea carboxylase [Solirubrobacteraceae bacterium]|nr:urea carboxylase [Solirubrobacteraceae bacterium]
MSFDTLLVANRGEIACRILRTAATLGLRTVAVYSDADRGAPHVSMADAAVRLGPAPARESYLRADAIIAAAREHGAGAVHPGYGLLSEDGGFARAVEDAGLVFVGPTPSQLRAFGAKDRARAMAREAGVPLLVGTEILPDVDCALADAERIGYPVMLKAVGGGGGIGMARCGCAAELESAFARVTRAADASFGSAGVYLERLVAEARHVEVQVFGDGTGRVLALGDRDCTLQRRHQKVVEEAPAPGLSPEVRDTVTTAAIALCRHARYRSAGTVEFVFDPERQAAYFLEVNARLQVEHTVTEEIFGVDLVEWMLRLAAGDDGMFTEPPPQVGGVHRHAVQARVYAEDPARDHQPSAGTLTDVRLPSGVRVDGWVQTGSEVTTAYDPLLVKVIATGVTRPEAIMRLQHALNETRLAGLRTNLGQLDAALSDERFRAAEHTTGTLARIADPGARIDVERAGTHTTVQDWPGRVGYWQVGVPPSGPMDDRSFRLGNLALGNAEGAPGLECALSGPALRFTHATAVCVCGAPARVALNDHEMPLWSPVTVPAGGVLDIGEIPGPGLRTYVLFAGGLEVPAYLDSAATFTLGGFGGHAGRSLLAGDTLQTLALDDALWPTGPVPVEEQPEIVSAWELGVLEGPHAAPEFFTEDDITEFYAAAWEVHFNSARTGVRLIGPRPRWARRDGGEAGLHPSNIHDTPYSVGAVDYTGDLPILLGPDGPSLGGFVCPATVARGERWKLGQLRPGDTVRFVALDEEAAAAARDLTRRRPGRVIGTAATEPDHGRVGELEPLDGRPRVTYRRSGDDNLLVEYGEMTLDLGLRMRVHALAERLADEGAPGILDLTPGIRSLQIQLDPDRLSVRRALALAQTVERELPPTDALSVPSRTVRLPLSWDDPATRLAIERYMAGVRADAPWCPWNIEFIRRINGLESVQEVHDVVFGAEYLVLGLGDVYLGAPVATPLDPRHRLVTTKYNPARTWTPENAVGIGGAYLCIYGMEGPGGYQFVGRTVQVWSRYRDAPPFAPGHPWLLRFFDRISWYPVSADELLEMRADLAAGRFAIEFDERTFSVADHRRFLDREAESIEAFRRRQTAAFAAERAAWAAAGEFDREAAPAPPAAAADELSLPDGAMLVHAPLSASVWQVDVAAGDSVSNGQRLITLEAMKMETALDSPVDGRVMDVLVGSGDQVVHGAPLIVLEPA